MPNGNVGKFYKTEDAASTFTDWVTRYGYDQLGMKPQELRKIYEVQKRDKLYISDHYMVAINKEPTHGFPGQRMWWLSIKRLDKEPIMDWRDLQAIKSQLCGPEAEAIQLFPSEKRVVDTSNQYHLWVFMPSSKNAPFPRIPVGWMIGGKSENNPDDPAHLPKAKQRPMSQESA